MIIDLLYIDIQSLHTQVTGVSDNIEKQEMYLEKIIFGHKY